MTLVIMRGQGVLYELNRQRNAWKVLKLLPDFATSHIFSYIMPDYDQNRIDSDFTVRRLLTYIDSVNPTFLRAVLNPAVVESRNWKLEGDISLCEPGSPREVHRMFRLGALGQFERIPGAMEAIRKFLGKNIKYTVY